MPEDNIALIAALLREKDEKKQVALMRELGARGVTEAVTPLLQWVEPGFAQSGTAIVALGQIGDPLAIRALIRACRHQSLAWIAKDALVDIGPSAVEPLIEALTNPHPDVRFWAIRALGELDDPRALEALQNSITQDYEPTNRQLARTTLKKLLIDHLASDDAALRLSAIEGLCWLDDSCAVEVLIPLTETDPDPEVRAAAQAALQALLASVNDDPFAAHDLPIRSRQTNLLIDKLRRTCGVALEKFARPADFAQESYTVDVLTDLMTTHADEPVRSLARDALQRLTFDYLCCPYPDAREIAVQGLYALRYDPSDDYQMDTLLAQIAEFDPDEIVRQAARSRLAS